MEWKERKYIYTKYTFHCAKEDIQTHIFKISIQYQSFLSPNRLQPFLRNKYTYSFHYGWHCSSSVSIPTLYDRRATDLQPGPNQSCYTTYRPMPISQILRSIFNDEINDFSLQIYGELNFQTNLRKKWSLIKNKWFGYDKWQPT